MTDVARSLDISISAEKLLFDAHSTLIFFLRLHCIAAKRSIDHVCPLRFWALRKNVLDSRSCTEIWLSTLLLYSLPPTYVQSTWHHFSDLCAACNVHWPSLLWVWWPDQMVVPLCNHDPKRGLTCVTHIWHRLGQPGSLHPPCVDQGTISTRECYNQSCTISVGNYYSRQACWTKVTPHPKSQTCSQVTKRLDGGVVVVQGA